MAAKYTRTNTQKTLCGTVYSESFNLPLGVLPSKKNVVECMVYLMRKDRAGKQQRTVQDGANLLAFILVQHWEYCNVYTITQLNVAKRVV